MFRYSSILAYLFVFFQVDKFAFSMKKMDADGKPQAVTVWTSLLKHNSTEYSFKVFINLFYHPVVSMLDGRPEPQINDEFQRILHLSDNTKTGDWYLYQNHTVIRVYGCDLAPYKLPKYLSVKIFALEYTRKIMNSDNIHFVSLNKKQQLRIKGQIGSFICNSRCVGEEADRMLKEMKFFMSFPWNYDPYGINSEMRVKNKNILYVHVSKLEIEKFSNQTLWVPNTLVKVEQQVPPTNVPPMTMPQVPKEKRPRQDLSPPVTEVSSEEFQLHTKRPKTIPVPGPTGEKEAPPTTMTKSVIPPFGSSLHKDITPVVPKKSTDSPLDTQPGKTGPKLSIFEKYKLNKKKNQTLTSSTYAHFRKKMSTAKHRLLSSFDTKKGRMHMAFLQAQVPDPKVITDYKRATFEFQTKDVHPTDQMDLHK
jgi:hypothetical protein